MKTRKLLYRVLVNKHPNPWDERVDQLYAQYRPQSALERILYRGHAAFEWKASEGGNGGAKAWHKFWNDKLLAAGYQGTLYEEGSRNLENLTGKSADWCAQKNALWWTPVSLTIEHSPIVLAVFGAEKATLGHGELAVVPLAYAGVFLGYNIYRHHEAKKKGRVLPNIGYFALGANLKEMFHQNGPHMYDEYAHRARREGTSVWYAGMKTVLEDIISTFTPKHRHE